MNDPTDPMRPRSTRSLFLGLVILNLAVILLAIFLGIFKYPDKSSPTRYFGEGRFPTFLSIVQLAATGAVCAAVFQRRHTTTGTRFSRNSGIWLAFALGFAFLALDEGFEIHENLDKWVHKYVLDAAETDFTDRIDDLIILGYGAIGLGVMLVYRRELLRFGAALPYLVFSFVMSVLSIGMDALTNREDLISGGLHTWMTVGDDAFKFLAEAGFLAAAAAALQRAKVDASRRLPS